MILSIFYNLQDRFNRLLNVNLDNSTIELNFVKHCEIVDIREEGQEMN